MPPPLLIVDVQRGFINRYTEHVPDRVARLVQRGRYEHLLFTQFVNVNDSPYRRFLDWEDCASPPETDFAPEIEALAKRGAVFQKRGFTGMPDELAAYLRQEKVEQIFVVGIDTDMCVLKVTLDVFDLGIQPVVLVDCCASTAGLQAHLAGLAILSRNIGPKQLRDTGLGDGLIAGASPT